MPFSFGQHSTLLAAGLLVTGLLAGCAPVPGSPTAPMASFDTTSTSSSLAEHQKTDALPLFLVPDLDVVTETDEHRRIFARHFAVPSAPEIARAQSALVQAGIDGYLAANAPAAASSEPSLAELNIRSHLTAVSTHAVGIRVNTYESSDTGSGTRYKTQWFAPDDSPVLDSRDLFGSDDDWAQFKEFIVQAASTDSRMFLGGTHDLDETWLDSVNFDFAGNALVEFDDNAAGPGAAGPLVVTVDAGQVTALLSDFGAQARKASTSPSPRVQLGLLQDAATRPKDALPAAGTGTGAAPGQGRPGVAPKRSVDCSTSKCVALTFDDGPGPNTGKLLDMLEEADAPSTFFVTGPNAKLRPGILRRMAAEGHELGNHTWNHRSLTSMSTSQVRSEIDRTNAVIAQAVELPATLLRPPYGARNSITDRLASTPVVLWDVDTLDWKHRNTRKVVDAAVNQSRPGSIVLMHDIHSSTVAAVPRILAGLRAKGYTFVTVTELLGPTGLEAGKTYHRAPRQAATPGPAAHQPSGEVRYP